MQILPYGDVWSAPTRTLGEILASSPAEDTLRLALECGYFSKFAAMKDHRLVERLIDWQLALLEDWLGPALDLLPSGYVEVKSFPGIATLQRHGRRLSPDLLRNVWYVRYLSSIFDFRKGLGPARVLEIGSGNGSFSFALKAYCPASTFYLVDIPESLQVAALYLKEALPGARTAHVLSEEDELPADGQCDFVFVSVSSADRLAGLHFDLAVNIWSFGEMPNHFVSKWFDLIQKKCRVDRLFTLNAFLSPVTIHSLPRVKQGDWLFQLDEFWEIERFNIEPEIHRCPFIRDFYKGIAYVARRIENDNERVQQKATAAEQASEAYVADWVHLAAGQHLGNAILPASISLVRLRAQVDYISNFTIEGDMNGPVFALWNDFRVNSNAVSASLLVAYLGMTTRTDPNLISSKEEVFLLNRLPHSKLHDEYRRLLRQNEEPEIVYEGDIFGIQTACDRAITLMTQNDYQGAEDLFASVAVLAPGHGDCWYYLARIAEAKRDAFMAAVIARHACMLAPDYQHYHDLQRRLTAVVQQKSWLGDLWKRQSGVNASRFSSLITKALCAFGGADNAQQASAAAFLLGGEGYECFCEYAIILRNQGDAKLADAFETAAIAQACLTAKSGT
jgi:hypothetical protein